MRTIDRTFGNGNEMHDIRNTYFRAGTLSLYAVSTAWEAELVMGHAGALHEVRVLQAFLAQSTLESRRRDRFSAGSLSDRALRRRRHGRG